MDAQWIWTGAAVLLCLYMLHVNRGLSSVPEEAASLSPTRLDAASITAVHTRLSRNPTSVVLPPKTGRRYIVVGGAGFLPGWIVVHLVARGEDPRRIRIIDLRAPTRQDLTTGPAAGVAFHQADVSNAESVLAAFTARWPDTLGGEDGPVTVFHSAANIRFWERVEWLLPFSNRVNVAGTRNVIDACLKIGASVLVCTSSGSVAVRRTRFWLWPWQRYPKDFVQVLDDHTPLPSRHDGYFSNYAVSKAQGERLVCEADRTVLWNGTMLRTGCIRPGNGVYGPGDALAGSYLVRQNNPTWIRNIIQSFVYVENSSLAHLLYERRLLEMGEGGSGPDIGGQAFNVTDPNPPISYGDVYTVLSTLTSGTTRFPDLPPALMLGVAHVLEAYYVLRMWHPVLLRMLPPIKGEAMFLQPSMFSLTQIHLVFDDSRARRPAAEGGLGYKGQWTSVEGLCKLVIEWEMTRRGEEGWRGPHKPWAWVKGNGGVM